MNLIADSSTIHPSLATNILCAALGLLLLRTLWRLLTGYYDRPRDARGRTERFKDYPMRETGEHFGYRVAKRVERMERYGRD